MPAAIVTGSSRGIGAATAERFAADGYDVAVNYHTSPDAAEDTAAAVREAGARAVVVGADVSEFEGARRLVDRTVEALGRVDHLVNNAGIDQHVHTDSLSPADFDRVTDVNVNSAFACTKAALPHLRAVADRPVRDGPDGGDGPGADGDDADPGTGRDGDDPGGDGRPGEGPDADVDADGSDAAAADGADPAPGPSVTNVSSILAFTGAAVECHYAASKAGLLGLTRSHARDFAPGIRVNAVAPGHVETDMTADRTPEQKRAELAEIPREEFGRPADVADAVAYLRDAGFVTGETLHVNGGELMH